MEYAKGNPTAFWEGSTCYWYSGTNKQKPRASARALLKEPSFGGALPDSRASACWTRRGRVDPKKKGAHKGAPLFSNYAISYSLHGVITLAVLVLRWSVMNLSTSASINSPLTTHAFSVKTSPVFASDEGSRKIFQGEPHLRVSPVS